MVRSKDTVSVALFSVAAVRMVGDAMAAAGVSSSFTVAVTEGKVGLPKKPPAQAPDRLWLMVATSSTPSPSCAAVAVTVCGTFQFPPWNASRLTKGVTLDSRVTSALLLVVRRFTAMNTSTFDALTATRKLEAAGVERHQAEAIAEGMRDAAAADRADLATKAGLAALRSEMRWMLGFQAALILAVAAKLFGIV